MAKSIAGDQSHSIKIVVRRNGKNTELRLEGSEAEVQRMESLFELKTGSKIKAKPFSNNAAALHKEINFLRNELQKVTEEAARGSADHVNTLKEKLASQEREISKIKADYEGAEEQNENLRQHIRRQQESFRTTQSRLERVEPLRCKVCNFLEPNCSCAG